MIVITNAVVLTSSEAVISRLISGGRALVVMFESSGSTFADAVGSWRRWGPVPSLQVKHAQGWTAQRDAQTRSNCTA
jgi:hypothetical protein